MGKKPNNGHTHCNDSATGVNYNYGPDEGHGALAVDDVLTPTYICIAE
jgi:hypothetical protein